MPGVLAVAAAVPAKGALGLDRRALSRLPLVELELSLHGPPLRRSSESGVISLGSKNLWQASLFRQKVERRAPRPGRWQEKAEPAAEDTHHLQA